MKTKILSLVTLFLLGTVAVFAGHKTEKFKVYGNCSMCEKRIEKAALAVDGVSKADWDKETKNGPCCFGRQQNRRAQSANGHCQSRT